MAEHRVLTEEGQKLWDSIALMEAEVQKSKVKVKPLKLKSIVFEPAPAQLSFLELEIKKLMLNSHLVVKDCDAIIAKFTNAKEYLTSDARVAREIHLNLFSRLQRILENLPAFEEEEHLTRELVTHGR